MVFSLVFTFYVLALLVLADAQILGKRQKASVITACVVPNTVALTFDDGPYDYIYDIDKTLKANNALGTFFFNGNNYRCIYDQESINRVKFIYDQGHQVASHTWSHKDLTTLTWDQINDEMWRVEQALQRITGAVPAFMRPPFGSYNDQVLEVSGQRGQAVSNWDFDCRDSVGATPEQSKALYKEVADRHPSTILTLNHETYSSTVYDVLPYAIEQLKAKGYDFVTLAQCLGKPAYQSAGPPQQPSPDWHC